MGGRQPERCGMKARILFLRGWIKAFTCLMVARYRIFWGFCPLCNSDAPEIDKCILCDNNREWPRTQRTLDSWQEQYESIYRMRMMTYRAVLDSRLGRIERSEKLEGE